MKNVAYIKIGTPSATYGIMIPDMTYEQACECVADARREDGHFAFALQNETLHISEQAIFVHIYTKEENYAYTTPTINYHRC